LGKSRLGGGGGEGDIRQSISSRSDGKERRKNKMKKLVFFFLRVALLLFPLM